jgi:hypothetical protein
LRGIDVAVKAQRVPCRCQAGGIRLRGLDETVVLEGMINWHVRNVLASAQLIKDLALRWSDRWKRGENVMSSIFYIIGVVVVVLIILSFLGLR